jgi:prepilin-type N-terminal cleavage/methylation domain-containing protein
MKKSRSLAFTLIELLVVISIIGILAALALPAITGALARGQMTQTLSNCKQLHLATQQMALDATTTGDTNLGWPGDLSATPTFAQWATNITGGNYLTPSDFAKLLSAPAVVVPVAATNSAPTKSAIVVYAVAENSEGSTVFLSSANFTNSTSGGTAPLATAKPYGNKGFVVFRKAGDGAILQPRQTGSAYTNIIGQFTNVLSGNPAP